MEEVIEQPDEKIIIAGEFSSYNGVAVGNIVRLDKYGKIDESFATGSGFAFTDPNPNFLEPWIDDLALTTDGKILAGGVFNSYNGVSVPPLVLLNPDGSLDTAFIARVSGAFTGAATLSALYLDSDQRILISYQIQTTTSLSRIIRLNPSGELDATFQPVVLDGVGWNRINVIDVQADGKILIGGYATYILGSNNHRLARLNADGALDTTFHTNFPPPALVFGRTPTVWDILEQDDGKIIVVGYFGNDITRLNTDGSFDTTFNVGVGFSDDSFMGSEVYDIEQLIDGRFVVGGYFSNYQNVSRNDIVILHADGSLDVNADPGVGFDGMEQAAVGAIRGLQNGNIIAVGHFNHYQGFKVTNHLIRLHSNLNWDHTFNSGTGANERVSIISPSDDGKILIGGSFSMYNGEIRQRMARLLPDGEVDPAFLSPNLATKTVSALASQSDGKVLIAYAYELPSGQDAINLMRTLPNGQPDDSFITGSGFNNIVTCMVVQDDNKIIVAGQFTQYNESTAKRILRLHPDGAIDHTFDAGYGANMQIESMLITANGKILIVGQFTLYDSVAANRIALLNPDGSLDASFSVDANGTINNVAIDPDGKIIIGGRFTQIGNDSINHVARLHSDGSLDTTFQSGLGFSTPGFLRLVVQNDGKIVAGGRFVSYDGFPSPRLARINWDGSFDTTFLIGTGANHWVRALAVQNDGKILAGGDFTSINGIGRNRIARLFGPSPDGVRPVASLQKAIRVFPNPAGSDIFVETPTVRGNTTLRFYDMQGRIVMEIRQNIHETPRVHVGMLKPGMYILEVSDGTNLARTRILKN